VRPHAVHLSAAGPGLAGHIAHAAYLGGHMEYGVALDGIEAELFAIAPGVAQPFIPGQQVRVDFDPNGIAVVRPD